MKSNEKIKTKEPSQEDGRDGSQDLEFLFFIQLLQTSLENLIEANFY
jgi:hypothetical protein